MRAQWIATPYPNYRHREWKRVGSSDRLAIGVHGARKSRNVRPMPGKAISPDPTEATTTSGGAPDSHAIGGRCLLRRPSTRRNQPRQPDCGDEHDQREERLDRRQHAEDSSRNGHSLPPNHTKSQPHRIDVAHHSGRTRRRHCRDRAAGRVGCEDRRCPLRNVQRHHEHSERRARRPKNIGRPDVPALPVRGRQSRPAARAETQTARSQSRIRGDPRHHQ